MRSKLDFAEETSTQYFPESSKVVSTNKNSWVSIVRVSGLYQNCGLFNTTTVASKHTLRLMIRAYHNTIQGAL